jgi:uncharacterized membrane-anchored protein YjiN (DUF445 family)
MGIILSSFRGCGREFLKNTHGDKVKIYDAIADIPATDIEGKTNQDLLEEYYNKVMDNVDSYDIVFIDSSTGIRDTFNEHGVDYDVFYPSKERRGEFIENQVRKRAKPEVIRSLDKNFEKWVQEIDDDEAPNCYKHKLSKMGEFIGNSPIIMQYIDSLKNQLKEPINNEVKTEENDAN